MVGGVEWVVRVFRLDLDLDFRLTILQSLVGICSTGVLYWQIEQVLRLSDIFIKVYTGELCTQQAFTSESHSFVSLCIFIHSRHSSPTTSDTRVQSYKKSTRTEDIRSNTN